MADKFQIPEMEDMARKIAELTTPIMELQPTLAELTAPIIEWQPTLADLTMPIMELHPTLAEITASIREAQPTLAEITAPIREAQQGLTELTGPTQGVQLALEELATPYRNFAESYFDLARGQVFVEKYADFPSPSLQKEHLKDVATEKMILLLGYMPLGDSKITEYNEKVQKIIEVNLKGEQYQFAYLATHLLFMTYMYSVVWRISRLYHDRYVDVLTFLKGYGEEGTNFQEVGSVFDYHKIHEGDVFEFLKIIGIDNTYVCEMKRLVRTRNGMAHANGEFQIISKEQYDDAFDNIIGVIKEINRKLEPHIKKWYEMQLIAYMKNGDGEAGEFIENLVAIENFSAVELDMCANYGVSNLTSRRRHPEFTVEQGKLVKRLHKQVMEKYKTQKEA